MKSITFETKNQSTRFTEILLRSARTEVEYAVQTVEEHLTAFGKLEKARMSSVRKTVSKTSASHKKTSEMESFLGQAAGINDTSIIGAFL